jgi:protein-disulfide isomerase/uncharacterized membrane protein
MVSRNRTLLAILLTLGGAALALLLLLQHHGEGQAVSAVDAVCGEGRQSGCETVNQSRYSTLAGVPLAAAGLAFSLSLAALLGLGLLAGQEALAAAAALALLALGLGLFVDLALLALQAFVIGAYCRLCLASYVLNLATFVLLLPARRGLAGLRGALARPETRLAGGNWLVTTLALLAAVASGDALLVAREGSRAVRMLGTPSAAAASSVAAVATPSPPASAAPAAGTPGASEAGRWREQAEAAQAEARRLQEILSTPEKLQQYLADKAALEFDRAEVQTLDLSQAPGLGPAGAPVKVVTYSDFLCPWCRNLAGGLKGFLPQSGGRVQLFFKHFPLDTACNPNLKAGVHPGSCLLALGAICAQEQGRFWPYHDKAFEEPLKDVSRETVVRLGSNAGLSATALEACLASPKTRDKLAADIQEARRVGVEGTPTLFIGGKKLPGVSTFIMAVEKELKRLGQPPLPPPPGR